VNRGVPRTSGWGDMMFSDEVVVKDRVGVRFSERGVGSEGGRRDRNGH